MRKLLCALLALSFASSLSASPALDAVCRAQALLSPGAWSKIVSIGLEGFSPLSVKRVYGLVFEFNSILWLYRPDSGTESISHTKGDTEREVEELPSLLREVFPRMKEYRVEELQKGPAAPASEGELPNACFVKSVHALGTLDAQDEFRKVALLCYYYEETRRGHTVLYFETKRGAYVLDPTRSQEPEPVQGGEDPLDIARQLEPRTPLAGARFLPVDSKALPAAP